MGDSEEQLIGSAADEGAVVTDEERPEDGTPVDLPLLWSSMDLPGMEDRD